MLHEMSDDKRDEIVYVLQVGDSEMRITVDAHTLELVGRKGFYRMGNVMPDPTFSVGNVESPYDAAVEHFADVGFSSARRACEEADPFAQTEQQPVATILLPDPLDERDGIPLSHVDIRRLAALPAGTKLYAAPVPQTEQQPLFYINPFVIDELEGKRKPSPGGLTWSRTACGHWTFAVYAAPIAQTEQQPPYPHEAMDVIATSRYQVVASGSGPLSRYYVRAGDGKCELYRGGKSDCEHVARKLAGAFLDGGLTAFGLYAAPIAQTALTTQGAVEQ